MAKPKLAALVVGQSPRPEVVAEVHGAVGDAVDVELFGCLDGLSRAEIDALPPLDGADTLFTRLPDGSGVKVSKAAVVRHGTAKLERLASAGYDVAMVACTGEFPEWTERFRVVFPSRVMNATVAAVLPKGRLGVFVPLPEQIEKLGGRWAKAGYEVTAVALSPNASDDEVRAAAADMAKGRPELIVYDCISYTSAIKRLAGPIAGAPGVLAVTACARLAAELAS